MSIGYVVSLAQGRWHIACAIVGGVGRPPASSRSDSSFGLVVPIAMSGSSLRGRAWHRPRHRGAWCSHCPVWVFLARKCLSSLGHELCPPCIGAWALAQSSVSLLIFGSAVLQVWHILRVVLSAHRYGVLHSFFLGQPPNVRACCSAGPAHFAGCLVSTQVWCIAHFPGSASKCSGLLSCRSGTFCRVSCQYTDIVYCTFS